MMINGLGGDAELDGDAAVTETPCDPAKRLKFAAREAERVVARARPASARDASDAGSAHALPQ